MPDSPWSIARVLVQPPKRGDGTQENLELHAQSVSFTWSWGSNPASGEITYVAPDEYPSVISGAFLEMELYGKTFYGVCKAGPLKTADQVIPTVRASSGRQVTLSFEDCRTYLKWDKVFCAFNMLEVRIVDGHRLRRYWHLLPQNFRRWQKSWTTRPLTAATILDFIFNAETIGTAWQRIYHPDQVKFPVYGIDALNGKRLDEMLLEISEAQGLLFTLQGGPFRLVWTRKGEGVLPTFPQRSDHQRLSAAISENPTRMFVVGDRNVFLFLDLPLAPDWNRAWEEVFDLDLLADDLFNHEIDPASGNRYNAIPGDEEQARGRQLAAARAREITVREYAALRLKRGADFRDFRRFGGRSRMDMPAALYIQNLVFRAFRPHFALNIGGHEVSTASLDLSEEVVAKVTHDINTGKMSASLAEVTGGNGYAIARGFNVGQELFSAIRPERFNLDDFQNALNLWRPVSFQADESGEDGRFIIFDEPMILSRNLLFIVNGYAVINANPIFEPPEVRAALTFEGNKFFYTHGTGSRDDSVYVSGLRAEFVVDSAKVAEVPYADGRYSGDKAKEIAQSLIALPYVYASGGFDFELKPDDIIPDLNGMINRITLELSSAGQVCRVEFTNERPVRYYQPERELDRRVRYQTLLPGQQELKDQAQTLKLLAGAFRQSPGLAKKLSEFFKTRVGANETTYPVLIAGGTGTLPVGTPLWKEPYPKQTRAVMPSTVSDLHTEFVGVTVRQDENASRPIRAQKTGQFLARVRGPVSFGDQVVRANGADYLVKKEDGSATGIGTVEQSIATDDVQLIPVVSGGGTGGVGSSKRRAVWG